jgi:hypothetical protein
VGAVPSSGPSALLPSRNPLTGGLSALYLGAERENRPLPWSDRAGGRACEQRLFRQLGLCPVYALTAASNVGKQIEHWDGFDVLAALVS